MLERGAVEGEVFHRGAVQALAPDEPEVLPRLAALVRHELIRPERPQFPGEDGFRFRHLLIRDAAYDALPKAVRADLHRRFADWLENKKALVELDELVGYHLEQAARYEAELGRPDDALALRAGDRLLAAGRRSLGRGDERAAAGLLERALSLTRPLRSDVLAEIDLAQALWHDPERAAEIADEAAVRAGAAGDETGEALARAMAALLPHLCLARGSPDELEALLLEARGRLEEAEDHAGLAYVWSALGYGVANMRSRADDWAAASEQALHHSRLAGRSNPPPTDLGVALVIGSRPADEALDAIDRLLAEARSPGLLASRAWLLAMLDRERGGLAGRPGGGGEAAERPPLGRLVARRDLDPRRRPRGCEQTSARRLRLARGNGAAPGSSRPTWAVSAANCACSAASTKRSRPRARAIARRGVRRRPGVGLPLAPGAGTCPRAPTASWPRPNGWRGRRSPRASYPTRSTTSALPCGTWRRFSRQPGASTRQKQRSSRRSTAAERKKNLALARQVRERLAQLREQVLPA